MNKTIASIVAAASLAQVFATSVAAADLVTTYEEPDQRDGVKIGVLTCDVGGGVGYVLGSAKSVDCVFNGTRGSVDHYSGTIR
jgi:hypothetical protein